MRRFLPFLLAAALLVLPFGRPPIASGATPGTTLIGVRAPGPTDAFDLDTMRGWQGKRNAVALVFRSDALPAAQLLPKLTSVWRAGSVPILSIELTSPNAAIAAGVADAQIDAVADALKVWLAGPDLAYGNADDRRIYLRPGWEANGSWYPWSPCAPGGGAAGEYRAMWQHLHDRYTSAGIGRDHAAWIFSVAQTDSSPACAVESLYPGGEYVDWTGIDGYTWSFDATPTTVFGPMTARLRALAPGLPLAITEAGAMTTTSGGKSLYIQRYFSWIRANDVRMAVWFNTDKERDWSVFGGLLGDEVYRAGVDVYSAWKAYRQGVASSRIVGGDATNPRVLTDAQFLGQ